MRVKHVPIGEIKEGERFRVDLGDLADLMASIKERGLLHPISIDQSYVLVAGGRRLAACRELGLEKVPCVIHSLEGELDLREIELLENVVRKDLTWPERARLEQAIYTLKKDKDPTWTKTQQAELMGGSRGASARRLEMADVLDAIPELAECKTEDEAYKKYKRLEEDIIREQLSKSASANVKNMALKAKASYNIGDAFEGIKKVKAGVINFAEVDPPYAVDLERRKSRNQDTEQIERYNEVDDDKYLDFVLDMAREVYRVLYKDSFAVWWFGPSWQEPVRQMLELAGFKVNDIPAIWTKGSVGQTASPDTTLGSSYEPFFICRKGSPKLAKPGRSNVFHFSPVAPQKKIHPTERPIEMMLEIMDTFTYPGGSVIVPFLGSGVTMRAAYLRHNNGFGWDFDPITKRRFIGEVQRDWEGSEDEE